MEMKGRLSSPKVTRTMLGIQLVPNKCLLDEFAAGLDFPKKADFISHSLSLLLR